MQEVIKALRQKADLVDASSNKQQAFTDLYISFASFASHDLEHMEAEETRYHPMMLRYFTQSEIETIELEALQQLEVEWWLSVFFKPQLFISYCSDSKW